MPGSQLDLRADCQTTAMGIMPHTDVQRAVDLALSMDIPFCPQLPNVSFFEDMYVQTSQSFPGIVIDPANTKISFDHAKFQEDLVDYSRRIDEPDTFTLSRDYSATYHLFMAKDLRGYSAIRGQVTGPVSFGFRVTDENSRPIIYDEEIRALLFDFIQRKTSQQYRQLKDKNRNAFVWLDEPGLGWVFSGLSGYDDIHARQDYQAFLAGIDGPRALHLCANVNLPYLLGLGVDLLSFDAYQMELMPKGYAGAIADFLRGGGIIAWGIVPTNSDGLAKETPETLARLLTGYWEVVSRNTGLSARQIASQSLLAPARCCLKNIGRVGANDDVRNCQVGATTIEEELVERAFAHLKTLSGILRNEFEL